MACIFVFVSARKPPVAENTQCTLPLKPKPQIGPIFLPPQQTIPNYLPQQETTPNFLPQQQTTNSPSTLLADANKTVLESLPIKKKISYTIEYIVKGLPEVQEEPVPLLNNNQSNSPPQDTVQNLSIDEEKKCICDDQSKQFLPNPSVDEENVFFEDYSKHPSQDLNIEEKIFVPGKCSKDIPQCTSVIKRNFFPDNQSNQPPQYSGVIKTNFCPNQIKHLSQNPSVEGKHFFAQNKNMESLRKIAFNNDESISHFSACERKINVIEKEKAGNNNNYYGSLCQYPDVTSEVKHARTPLNTINQETHSPQLPIPSPNYPVQTQLPIETAANAQLPNTIVPTLNNNYITAPHSASQSELKENTPSADCLLPHSNKLKNNVNIELKSDLKQKGHLSNLDISECKNNHLNSNLKSVIQQCNVLKIQCETSNDSQMFKKSTETENSFTVLNIPNLGFQTPPSKRPKLSKIDLATIKRKMRRKKRLLQGINETKENRECAKSHEPKRKTFEYGVQVYGYSDSSNSSIYSSSEYESDLSEVDMCIRSGPPPKPDFRHEKMEFLKLFELTTHNEKNCKLFFLIFKSF